MHPKDVKLTASQASFLADNINVIMDAMDNGHKNSQITALLPPKNLESAKAMGMEVIGVPMPAGSAPMFRSLWDRLDSPPTATITHDWEIPETNLSNENLRRVYGVPREEFSEWLEREDLREGK